MPISDNMNVPYISTVVGALSPMSALDIGIGMGKFAYILREKCEWTAWVEDVNCVKKENQRIRIDGIEVCPEYITPLQEFLYDKIYIGLAQDIIPTLGDFDLINMGDVIEHFDKSQGQQLLDTLFKKARQGILLTTPIGEYDQSGEGGNPFQEHQSIWSPADLRRFPFVWARKIAKRQWIMLISKEKFWIRDPSKPRKDEIQLEKRNARRRTLKATCKWMLGEKGLNYIVNMKRRLEGWKSNL